MSFMSTKQLLFLLSFFFSHYLFSQTPTITSFTPASGKSNTSVTITGTNLNGATSVSFGGTAAAFFSVQSATQIRAVVGSGSSGSISVTTPSGTATKAGFTFFPPPTITSFSPMSAGYGITINITGKNFTGTTAVSFGGYAALSFSVLTDSTLIAVVGVGASGNISITSNYGQGFKVGFIHTGPVISSFTPTTGPVGTTVNIRGINFTGTTSVRFGSIPASSFSVDSATSITAVCGGADSSGTISVTTSNGTYTANGFNIPSIKSTTPGNGNYGTILTIKGFNFTGANSVTIGNKSAESYSVLSDTLMTAKVNYGCNGPVIVSNTFGSGIGQNFSYNYPQPIITSFTPTSGPSGTVITIKGSGLTDTRTVTIGNISASSYNVVSDSVLTAVVSSANSTDIQLTTPGGFAYTTGFTYTGPIINSFTPTTGTTGTQVTFTGNNLTGVTAITFGGVPAASFSVLSPTSIIAVVASGRSGPVTITSPSGVATVYSFLMVPQVTSFTPASGVVGTVVTINGKDFDSTINGNVVFFGAVRAQIVSATSSKLMAKVPAGATYEPISVTTNSLTGYAKMPFIVTFQNSALLTPKSFAPMVEYYALYENSGAYGVNGSYISDIDGDGKSDMVVLKNITFNSNKGFCIFRNKTANGIIDFDPAVQLGDFIQNATGIVVKDMDGDGKPDIAVTNGGGGTSVVSVYRNISIPGTIAFAQKADYSVGSNIGNPAIGDLDGDGKPDLVIPNGNGSNVISIFKNNSSMGNISFLPKVNYVVGSLPESVAINDLNGDGKPDLAVAHSNSTYVSILKNTSTTGLISFAAKIDYPTNSGAYDIHVTDLEGDGNPDIIVANSASNNFSILKNNGTNGAIGFATKVDYATGNTPYGISIGDINGDGKVDIAVANNDNNTVWVFPNTSSNGNITLASKVSFSTGNQPRTVSLGDFNGDGRPEMVTPNWVAYTASVLENRVGLAIAATVCPPVGNTIISSFVTGAAYQWQVDSGNGFVNINDNANYGGTNTANLQLTSISSSLYGYLYRCVVDGLDNEFYKLTVTNTWVGGVNNNWENAGNWGCGVVPDANTDVTINAGPVILNANTTVRSLTIKSGVNFTIKNGVILTIR